MEKLIEVRGINAVYGAKAVLTDIDLDVWEDDFLVITGPNGGGKTTLLKVILGLMKPASGAVAFFDRGRQVASHKVGYLPQINAVDKQFPISVYDVVASGLADGKHLFMRLTDERKERIHAIIARMGLEQYAGQAVGELSGGQFQRVLLARAMVSRPRILILDEPNTYIDKQFEQQFHELLGEINTDTAIILVTHDVGILTPLIKNIVYINNEIQIIGK